MFIYKIKAPFTCLINQSHKQFTAGEEFQSETLLPQLEMYANLGFFEVSEINIEKIKKTPKVNTPKVEEKNKDYSSLSLEELQTEYTKQTGKNLSPKFVNDKEWIISKLN